MRALHLFFQLHRPYSLQAPDGARSDYFGGEADFREANRTEYQPLFALLERNSQKYREMRFSLAISGIWLEQAEKYDPELIRRLKKLVNLGNVEILAQPYDYSLSSFYDQDEFEAQIEQALKKIDQIFGVKPEVLALPELIYHDKVGIWAKKQGFRAVLAGNADSVFGAMSPNQVFEAKLGETTGELKLIFQNSRFSEAIRLAKELTLVEQEAPKTALEAADLPSTGPKIPERSPTAQEFVRGFTGTRGGLERKIAPVKRVKSSGMMGFSAKKCQKGLEIESLHGNLISICLTPAIFRDYREMGIVRFFDELFAAWMNIPGNKIVAAREICELGASRCEISVKTTINWRGEGIRARSGGRALVKTEDIRYCPPEWLREKRQVELSKRLYGLRYEIARTKDRDLYREFQKLTDLCYMAELGARTPRLGGEKLTRDPLELKQVEGRFTAILDDFERRIEEKLPKSARITAKAGEKVPEETTASEFVVKVTRIPGKKRPQQTAMEKKAPVQEQPKEVDWDDLVWNEDDMYRALDNAEAALDYVETGEAETYLSDEEAEDVVEAELSMLEDRLMRKKSVAEQNLRDLIEAELVSEGQTKKRVKRKIVFE